MPEPKSADESVPCTADEHMGTQTDNGKEAQTAAQRSSTVRSISPYAPAGIAPMLRPMSRRTMASHGMEHRQQPSRGHARPTKAAGEHSEAERMAARALRHRQERHRCTQTEDTASHSIERSGHEAQRVGRDADDGGTCRCLPHRSTMPPHDGFEVSMRVHEREDGPMHVGAATMPCHHRQLLPMSLHIATTSSCMLSSEQMPTGGRPRRRSAFQQCAGCRRDG